MEKNEIKKALYKQKPEAKLLFIRQGHVYYSTWINVNDENDRRVVFKIPVEDMGDADFLPEMDGKLLIRWIYEE